jgi:ketosteroid isomerase-like protein
MATRRSKPRKSGRRSSAGRSGKAGSSGKAGKASRRGAKSRRAAGARAAKAPRRAAKAPPRAAQPKTSDSALVALARRIVQATQDPTLFELADLYAPDAVSREATGAVAKGLAELEAKLARWESMQEHAEWEPRRIFADGDTICIEWDATVRMRDGRIVPLAEVAVHEVRDGKIVSERFYYNPLALAPQAN